jgi:predicted nucleic acid-binding protein
VVIIDTSVWIDHVRSGNHIAARLLEDELVLLHPYVLGELALGTYRHRGSFFADMALLPEPLVAQSDEVMEFLEQHQLFGCGIGYVDLHLLASTALTVESRLWTFDKRLHQVAAKLSLAANLLQ